MYSAWLPCIKPECKMIRIIILCGMVHNNKIFFFKILQKFDRFTYFYWFTLSTHISPTPAAKQHVQTLHTVSASTCVNSWMVVFSDDGVLEGLSVSTSADWETASGGVSRVRELMETEQNVKLKRKHTNLQSHDALKTSYFLLRSVNSAKQTCFSTHPSGNFKHRTTNWDNSVAGYSQDESAVKDRVLK